MGSMSLRTTEPISLASLERRVSTDELLETTLRRCDLDTFITILSFDRFVKPPTNTHSRSLTSLDTISHYRNLLNRVERMSRLNLEERELIECWL